MYAAGAIALIWVLAFVYGIEFLQLPQGWRITIGLLAIGMVAALGLMI